MAPAQQLAETLGAVIDTMFPALEVQALQARKEGDKRLAAFLELDARDVGSNTIAEVLTGVSFLTPETQFQLGLLLRLLSWRLGTLLLGGAPALTRRFPFTQRFARLPPLQRDAVLQGLYSSHLGLLRKGFKGLKSLILSALFGLPDKAGTNPIWPFLEYAGPSLERPPPVPARLAAEAQLANALLHVPSAGADSPSALQMLLASRGLRVLPVRVGRKSAQEGTGAAADADAVVECDVVVVGSGAGGGVAAALLAQAGLRVVILEKGGFTPAAQLSLAEVPSFRAMYERAALQSTDDAAVSILAGSTLGGGTRVNWSASFRTPPHVRREWASCHGLSDVAGPLYDKALDAVCGRLGVCTGIPVHNGNNAALKVGLEAMGVACGEIPRNVAGAAHACGACCFGCASGEKQDVTGTFLADAAAAGACILTGMFAERVLTQSASAQTGCAPGGLAVLRNGFHGSDGAKDHGSAAPVNGSAGQDSPGPFAGPGPGSAQGAGPLDGSVGREPEVHLRKREAVGVAAVSGPSPGTGRRWRIVFRARTVVASAGSLHTPALLLRSGLTGRGNVGRNLRLHPATCITGLIPQEPGKPAVHQWEGAIMSVYSRAVADWDGSGYGAVVATPSAHPGLSVAAMPWLSGADFKLNVPDMPHSAPILVIVRDTGSGRVTLGPDGLPRVRYWPCKRDQAAMMQGMELGLRAMAGARARAVATLQQSWATRCFPTYDSSGRLHDPGAFEAFLAAVRREGIRKNSMAVFSAHQMGSARMGASPATSCADPNGLSWDCAGLYLADASVFPTPTGVNPMISVEAMAYMTIAKLVARLTGGGTPDTAKSLQ